jgi:hypothetical protein
MNRDHRHNVTKRNRPLILPQSPMLLNNENQTKKDCSKIISPDSPQSPILIVITVKQESTIETTIRSQILPQSPILVSL